MEVSNSRERVERSRVEMMRGYAETTGCRRQYLLGYFGETLEQPCGACDNCDDGLAVAGGETAQATSGSPYAVNSRVAHQRWGGGTVMSHDGDRITVLFDQEGYKTLSLDTVAEHGLLEAG